MFNPHSGEKTLASDLPKKHGFLRVVLKVWYCEGFRVAQLFILKGYQTEAGG